MAVDEGYFDGIACLSSYGGTNTTRFSTRLLLYEGHIPVGIFIAGKLLFGTKWHKKHKKHTHTKNTEKKRSKKGQLGEQKTGSG